MARKSLKLSSDNLNWAKEEFILTWPFAVIAPAVSNLPNEPVEVTELLTFAKKVASPSAEAKFRAWL